MSIKVAFDQYLEKARALYAGRVAEFAARSEASVVEMESVLGPVPDQFEPATLRTLTRLMDGTYNFDRLAAPMGDPKVYAEIVRAAKATLDGAKKQLESDEVLEPISHLLPDRIRRSSTHADAIECAAVIRDHALALIAMVSAQVDAVANAKTARERATGVTRLELVAHEVENLSSPATLDMIASFKP